MSNADGLIRMADTPRVPRWICDAVERERVKRTRAGRTMSISEMESMRIELENRQKTTF